MICSFQKSSPLILSMSWNETDWAVIAAGSVVAESIPSYVIAAGNPAKVIKQR